MKVPEKVQSLRLIESSPICALCFEAVRQQPMKNAVVDGADAQIVDKPVG
jgi:hypothetical protein